MKRIFICGAVLSLMLWACGDDSSSGLDAGGDESSSATELSSGAEDPTSSADAENPDSSTDVESSSTVPSSSSAISGSVTVPASDVSLTCASNQSNDNGRAGDGAIPPVAFMYNLGNKAEIVIQNVHMNCGTQLENIEVTVGGDTTLYVKPVIDESAPLANCICSTELDFYIDADEAFSDVTLLVFDYGGANNPSNKMSIIKETRVTPAN